MKYVIKNGFHTYIAQWLVHQTAETEIYESSYMDNKGYKPLHIIVLFDFSSINPHKKSTYLLSLRNDLTLRVLNI